MQYHTYAFRVFVFKSIFKKGTYTWRDGTNATYFAWAPGEPNDADGTSDCIHIDYASKNRQWTDSGCFSWNVYAFCEATLQ